MRSMSSRACAVSAVVVAMAFLFCGCETLGVGTKTSDGDFKAQLGEYKGLKHAVGVKDFDNQAGWHGQWNLGNNLSIMLESALFDTGRFVVVQREKLKAILDEQDLATSGRTAKATTVAKTGFLRPARYLATGAITVVEESQSGGGVGLAFKNLGVGIGGGKSQVTIIAQLIDTTTGVIVNKKTIKGKAGKVGFSLGTRIHGVGIGMGGFEKTPLAEAAQDCINHAALFFAKEMEKMPFDAAVAKVSMGGKVIINRGADNAIEVGQSFVMRETGEMITDPESGAVLGIEEGKDLGTLKVTKVEKEMSYCEVTTGDKSPKVGTRVVVSQ